jgi:DNA-3-methyladenine glycosylase I
MQRVGFTGIQQPLGALTLKTLNSNPQHMQPPLPRCWKTTEPLYVKYHDEEWGVPVHNDNKHFEFLVLDTFQAGLTWLLILKRRDDLRRAFDGFDPKKVASYTVSDLQRLMQAPGVIHNKLKIAATINNASKFLAVQAEFGSFDSYVWRLVGGRTINNSYNTLADVPAETEESRAMSKDLKARGFQFVGPTICYAYMQAAGLVNDHLVCCFRHGQLKKQNY